MAQIAAARSSAHAAALAWRSVWAAVSARREGNGAEAGAGMDVVMRADARVQPPPPPPSGAAQLRGRWCGRWAPRDDAPPSRGVSCNPSIAAASARVLLFLRARSCWGLRRSGGLAPGRRASGKKSDSQALHTKSGSNACTHAHVCLRCAIHWRHPPPEHATLAASASRPHSTSLRPGCATQAPGASLGAAWSRGAAHATLSASASRPRGTSSSLRLRRCPTPSSTLSRTAHASNTR